MDQPGGEAFQNENYPKGTSVPGSLAFAVWSDADTALGRYGAVHTADYVSGPYRFEILAGVSHWVPETAADDLDRLLLEHLTTYD